MSSTKERRCEINAVDKANSIVAKENIVANKNAVTKEANQLCLAARPVSSYETVKNLEPIRSLFLSLPQVGHASCFSAAS